MVNRSEDILVGRGAGCAGQIDAMGVVNEAVQGGVGVGRGADRLVPFVDRDLAGQDGPSAAVAFFEDFVEIAACAGVERIEALTDRLGMLVGGFARPGAPDTAPPAPRSTPRTRPRAEAGS